MTTVTVVINKMLQYKNNACNIICYKQTLKKTERAIKNGQSRDIGNIGHTRQINVRENRKCNQEWTIQKHW